MAIYLNTTPDPESKLVLGPRLRRQIELQIRQLEGRLKPSAQNLKNWPVCAICCASQHREAPMVDQRDAVLGFGIMIACGAAVAMAISFLAWVGFVLGVTTALAAAAIAGCDCE